MYKVEYNFDEWTPLEMFFYLIDIKEIPYYAKFEDWKNLKDYMLQLCKEHKYDSKRESS